MSAAHVSGGRADMFLAELASGRERLSARPLLVVAHPDDEVLALGGQLRRLPELRIVIATDGAPHDMADARRLGLSGRDAYAAIRAAESEASLRLAGVAPARVRRLGIVDKEAVRAVPAIARAIAEEARACRAELLVTHAYEGGHPDHDAVACAAHLAAASLDLELLEFPLYADVDGSGAMVMQRFVRDEDAASAVTLTLDLGAQMAKARMLARHRSQGPFLGRFSLEAERLRVADRQSFERQPQPWAPLYEGFGWGMAWRDWRAALSAGSAAAGVPLDPGPAALCAMNEHPPAERLSVPAGGACLDEAARLVC